MKVGVLALQGAFIEHIHILQRLGVDTKEVRLPEQLADLDGLIIPGGESTTIGKLAEIYGLIDPLRQFAGQKPVWGTCAGMILMAKEIRSHLKNRILAQGRGGAEFQPAGILQYFEDLKRGTNKEIGPKGIFEVASGMDQPLLAVMDIVVERNAFGRQQQSFETDLLVPVLKDGDKIPFHGVFIRSPKLLEVNGRAKEIAALADGTPVAAVEHQLLVTAFHPELTADTRFHRYFLSLVKS
jgi:5'-phosphate synthase pdxT subunit